MNYTHPAIFRLIARTKLEPLFCIFHDCLYNFIKKNIYKNTITYITNTIKYTSRFVGVFRENLEGPWDPDARLGAPIDVGALGHSLIGTTAGGAPPGQLTDSRFKKCFEHWFL